LARKLQYYDVEFKLEITPFLAADCSYHSMSHAPFKEFYLGIGFILVILSFSDTDVGQRPEFDGGQLRPVRDHQLPVSSTDDDQNRYHHHRGHLGLVSVYRCSYHYIQVVQCNKLIITSRLPAFPATLIDY
jgi:hypothetical protein